MASSFAHLACALFMALRSAAASPSAVAKRTSLSLEVLKASETLGDSEQKEHLIPALK